MNPKHHLSVLATLLPAVVLLAGAPPVLAQVDDDSQAAPAETGEPRWETGFEISSLQFDNFFQFPDDEPQQDVDAVRGEGRLTFRPSETWPLEVFGTAGITSYSDSIEESTQIGAGLRWDGARDDFEIGVRAEQDRPSFEVGDTLGTADILDAGLEYSRRVTEAWELTGLVAFQDQDYEVDDGRDNEYTGLGGAVRYRGWGYAFSPEVGVEVGERDAVRASEDYDQDEYWIKLRSAPIRPLYLSLRYRFRDREYPVGDPSASNFGREDERDQITFTADWRLTDLFGLTLYYAWEDAESTKASRTFTTSLLSLGLRVTP